MGYQQERRIPTIAGLFLLLILIVSGLYVFDNFSQFRGRAVQQNIPPKEITVSKVTYTSFAVYWMTDKAAQGFIRYGIGQSPNQTVYDSRDTDQIAKSYQLHYVELAGIPSQTAVSYEIVSAGETYPQPPISLPAQADTTAHLLPVYGEITTPANTPPKEAIVTVLLENNSSPWSTLITDTSSWALPIVSIRTRDHQQLFCTVMVCDDRTEMVIQTLTNEGLQQTTTTLGNARPYSTTIIAGGGTRTVPTQIPLPSPETLAAYTDITLAPTSFISPTITPVHEKPTPTISRQRLIHLTPTPTLRPTRTPTPKPKQAKNWDVTILTPKENGSLAFPKPLIRGQGVPDSEVIITLESSVKQIGKSKVRADGTWLWTPSYPLEPGGHTVTITTVDAKGKNTRISRRFTILKSGEQVLADSTPAATIVPEPTATPLPTETPTPLPLATPTPVIPVSGSGIPSLMFIGSGATLLLLALTLL
ncbi:hypothetical protein HY468_04970 [Candidatus Roizmanbacteria bacterium]|nr:hypothetical protein [Candidatus Roizmanbacteria bacterium]